jgi:hypothetical protein
MARARDRLRRICEIGICRSERSDHQQSHYLYLGSVPVQDRMIIAAVFSLNVAHPGPIFDDSKHVANSRGSSEDSAVGNETVTEAK